MTGRKLLLNERVEVRQFEEGLRGSWHPGLVVGVSELSRSVEYDELLSETGDSKLVESIPVSMTIEGLHQRRHVPSTYRGHIRPPPPVSYTPRNLSFGVSVDASYKDAWWEGVVFDWNDDASERSVFFPDEGDVHKFSVNKLRMTQDWDEFLGVWCDRGIWVLVQLAKEHEVDVPLSSYVKQLWSYLRLNFGFNKMISEWTCGVRTMWTRYLMEVVNEVRVNSRKGSHNPKIMVRVTAKNGNKRKDSEHDKITSGLSFPLLEQSGGALNIARSSEKREEKDSHVKCKQNKRSLKLKLKSQKQPVISRINKKRFKSDNLSMEKQISDCSSLISVNGTLDGESDRVSTIYSSVLNKVVHSVCLPMQSENSGKMKLRKDKPKSFKVCEDDSKQSPGDCCRQDKIISQVASDAQNNLAVTESQNLTNCGQINRDLAAIFSNRCQKQRKRKDSHVAVGKERKCSLKSKRISNQIQAVNTKSKHESKVKEKGPDAKQTQDDLSIHSRPPTLLFKNYKKNVSLKDMVSRPRKRKRKRGFRNVQLSDTICSFCHCGGDLILCNNCPSSYHLSCLELKDVPDGKWFCPSCRCGWCGFRGDNEQFTNACLQCTREYHVCCPSKTGCLLPTDYPLKNFCSKACYKLCGQLHQLLGISNPTSVDGLVWTLTRSMKNVYNFPGRPTIDSRIKLSHILRVMHECFEPAKEPHTQRDLVRDVVYSSMSKLKRLNFRGFYAVFLRKGDDIVSVATVRIHGLKVAEMPLVATPFKYRRQGMCRLLMGELVKLLTQLGVERLILPAIPQLRKTWEISFGFSEMPHSERLQLSGYPFLCFQGTMMLQKFLSSSMITRESNGTSQDSQGNSSNISLERSAVPKNKRRFCGIFYRRKPKPKIFGKENIVYGCNGSMQMYSYVYKRRCILVR